MQIRIRTASIELTPAIDDYVNKKLSLLEKFLVGSDDISGQEILCEVEIGKTTRHHKSGDVFKAEVNITSPGMKQIYAVAEESDLYSAIDVVRDEAERGIISNKGKRGAILKRGGAKIKEILKRIRVFRK